MLICRSICRTGDDRPYIFTDMLVQNLSKKFNEMLSFMRLTERSWLYYRKYPAGHDWELSLDRLLFDEISSMRHHRRNYRYLIYWAQYIKNIDIGSAATSKHAYYRSLCREIMKRLEYRGRHFTATLAAIAQRARLTHCLSRYEAVKSPHHDFGGRRILLASTWCLNSISWRSKRPRICHRSSSPYGGHDINSMIQYTTCWKLFECLLLFWMMRMSPISTPPRRIKYSTLRLSITMQSAPNTASCI